MLKTINSLITGVVVSYNSKELLQKAYESVRSYHPNLRIIIVDGSTPENPCYEYVKSLTGKLTRVISVGYNIGHGRGMCLGIYCAETPFVLLFDSDIVMLKSPVKDMLDMVDDGTFGVGYLEKIGFDGFDYGAKSNHNIEGWVRYLHPYFQLLQIKNYRKYHPYVHHGAPCYLTMIDINNKGLSDTVLREFPGLGHSSGKGFSWVGEPREYIQHDIAGTRAIQRSKGLFEVEGMWEIVNRVLSPNCAENLSKSTGKFVVPPKKVVLTEILGA